MFFFCYWLHFQEKLQGTINLYAVRPVAVRSTSRQITGGGTAVARVISSRAVTAAAWRPFGGIRISPRSSGRAARNALNWAGGTHLRAWIRVARTARGIGTVRVWVDLFGLSTTAVWVGVSHHVMTRTLRKRNNAMIGQIVLDLLVLCF